jgi:hypothetical protein
MSKGVLFIGFDSVTEKNKTLHYTKLAQISANLIRKHLNVPCAIISDKSIDEFEESIIVEKPAGTKRAVPISGTHESYTWHNDYRRAAFHLSPWDETVLLDVDYFIQTDKIKSLFDSDSPFMIVKDVYDPSGKDLFKNYRLLPNRTIPQCWATMMKFNKNAKPHFDYADMITHDYHYYSEIFGFTSGQFRNDMVFSIVAHMMPTDFIPWSMWMTSNVYSVVDANCNGIKFAHDNEVMRIKNDIHVLNKTLATDENQLDMLESWSLQK